MDAQNPTCIERVYVASDSRYFDPHQFRTLRNSLEKLLPKLMNGVSITNGDKLDVFSLRPLAYFTVKRGFDHKVCKGNIYKK